MFLKSLQIHKKSPVPETLFWSEMVAGRSSVKKMFLKTFAKFTGKHL